MTIFSRSFIESFLRENNLPKLETGKKWNDQPRLHSFIGIESYKDQANFMKQFGKDILSRVGIYIYEKNGEILYIGKATPFQSRLRHHFLESQNQHDGAPIFWEFYFSHMLKGTGLNIHLIPLGENYKELTPKDQRTLNREVEIIEMMYQELYDPAFDNHFAKFRKETGNKNPRRKAGITQEDTKVLKEAFYKTAA